MNAQRTPEAWKIGYRHNRAGEQRYCVERMGPNGVEFVLSASGKVSTFCTLKGAQFALRGAVAKDTQ